VEAHSERLRELAMQEETVARAIDLLLVVALFAAHAAFALGAGPFP
jgi:hypothetical protein